MADFVSAGSLEDRQLKLNKQRELMAKKQKQRQTQSGRVNASSSVPVAKHLRPSSSNPSSSTRSTSSCESHTQQVDSRSECSTEDSRPETRASNCSDDRPLLSQSSVVTQNSTQSAPQDMREKLAAAGIAASVECESSSSEDEDNAGVESSASTQQLIVAPMETTSRQGASIASQSIPLEAPLDTAGLGLVIADGQIRNLKDFIFRPAPENVTVRCRITRDKRGVGKHIYPVYYLHLECDSSHRLFLLAARKRKRSKSSNYLISVDASDLCRDADSYVAKLRGNFVGTSFTVYDNGENPLTGDVLPDLSNLREELCAIIYETNVLGFKGPRKMSVLIPAISLESKHRVSIKPRSESETILERYRAGEMVNITTLHNKQPQWSDDAHAYVLNFCGRVTQASVKNFQLVHSTREDYVVLQFGRIFEDEFTMDYNYPMNAVQAFAITLSSFDSKLACE